MREAFMRRTILLLFVLVSLGYSQRSIMSLPRDYSNQNVKFMSGCFSYDLDGPRDTRPYTWGTAEGAISEIKFMPPSGMQTVVHSITGDIVAWTRNETRGKFGVLYGFQQYPYNVGGAGELDMGDISTLLYGQTGSNSTEVTTRTFNKTFKKPIALPVHSLFVKGASWLNETGQEVHLEITYTVEYEFVEAK